MYSSKDLALFYVEYQSELVPYGMTMWAHCDRDNVPCGVMENYVRNIRKKIVAVQVTGRPSEGDYDDPVTTLRSTGVGRLWRCGR